MAEITNLPIDEITSQLDRLLSSSLFLQSQRQCRFLRYIVDEALAGNANRLKGYTIGIEVFDRDTSFDPNIDSIVRVEAGRLRSKLREYYLTEGINDAVLLELPKGSYAPVFSRNKPDDTVTNNSDLKQEYTQNSVAVLPIRSLSDDPKLNYFSDGMTDAIISTLAKNKSLKVISLTSVMQFKNTQKSLKQIADELNVSHIVEGTVFKDNNMIRIAAQLINSKTDFHLWSETFERELKDILRLQKGIADTIAASLIEEMEPEQQDVSNNDIISPEAYEEFLLGQRTRAQFTKDAFYKAAEHFKQAIDLEPEYAAAYSGMASCYCGLGSHGLEFECPKDIIPQGLEYAQHAIELDNILVDPHTYKGIMRLKYDWDWQSAEVCFKEALAISPNNARARMQYSMYFESLGQHEQAISEAQEALRVDPLSKEVNMNLAWQYYQADMYQEAKERLNRLLENEPDFWGAYWDLAHIYLAENDYDSAIQAFKKSDGSKGGYFMPLQGMGYAYAVNGKKTKALNVIKKLDELKKENYVSPYYYATIYMGLNDLENTFDYLQQAFEVRSRSLAWLNVAKEYIPLRNDERFKKLINKIGIPS